MKLFFYSFILLSLSACALLFPENEYLLEVEPVKFISCTTGMEKNTSCGRVPVPKDQADGFVVKVGRKKYYEIVGSYKDTESFRQEEVKLFGAFAAQEVVSRTYCNKAEVPENWRYIIRWEGRGERAIYVTCKN